MAGIHSAPMKNLAGWPCGPPGIPCQVPQWGFVAGKCNRIGKIAYLYSKGAVHDVTPLPFKVGVTGIGGPKMTERDVAFPGAVVATDWVPMT
jgi:glucose dehydrogenase